MQRVRIGLTGLSCVFLLVLLAAAFFGLAPADRGVSDPSVAGNGMDNAANVDDPKDPLAELGVTPGGQPEPPRAPKPGGAAR